MPSEFYNEEDAEAILREASRRMPAGGAMSRERLFATAAELGISADVVLAAEQAHIQNSIDQELALEFKLSQRSRFWERNLRALIFGAGCFFFFAAGSHHAWWLLALSVAFLLRVVSTIPGHFLPASERYKLAFNKWKRKRGSSDS